MHLSGPLLVRLLVRLFVRRHLVGRQLRASLPIWARTARQPDREKTSRLPSGVEAFQRSLRGRDADDRRAYIHSLHFWKWQGKT